MTHSNRSFPIVSAPTAIKYDSCDHIADDVANLLKYIRALHKVENNCYNYDQLADDSVALQTHMIDDHAEVVILHTMASQINNISERFPGFEAFNAGFETFKGEFGNVLKMILDNQNEVNQEHFLVRNKQAELDAYANKAKYAEPKSKNVSDGETNKSTPVSDITANESVPTSKPSSNHSGVPHLKKPSAPQDKSSRKIQQKQRKTLYIGDSISGNVDIPALENATQTKFVVAKA